MRLFIVVLLLSSPAFAREFDFKSASVGTYLRGEYGLSQRGDASFADSSGTSVNFDGTRTSFAAGEFGLILAGDKQIVRIGAQVLLPRRLAAIAGSASDGTKYFDLDTKVTAFIPQANLDMVVKAFPESRLSVSIGGGLAFVTTQNIYTLTSAGFAHFAGVDNHTETGRGSGIDLQTSAQYEMMFADHATLVFELGYRYCKIAQLKTTGAVTTISGTYADGDKLKNNDGSDRTLDLGGPFAGAGFRFYF